MIPLKRLLRALLLATSALLVYGCAAAAPQSAWGEITLIAETRQSAAPALWFADGHALTAWIGDDERGIHHDARWIEGIQTGEPVTLPLPPVHPHAQLLLPGDGDKHHLLWLDGNELGETRLYSAILTGNLDVERGPTNVSNAETYNFAAAPGANGTIWAAWTEGSAAFPDLYLGSIDAPGRPQAPIQIATDARNPAMAYADDGTIYLFYLSGNVLIRTRLINGAILDASALTSTIAIGDGDRLHGLYAGIDQTFGYVFWNVTRADGENETWMASGRLDSAVWPPPLRLTDIEGTPLTWAAPHIQQANTLSVAGQFGGNLAVFGFQNGSLQSIQIVVADQPLLAPPTLIIDDQERLALAWSLPRPNLPAQLLYSARP